MRIAVDTNRYVDFARAVPEAVSRLRAADQILMPFVVLGELRAGSLGGSSGPEDDASLVRFLNSPRVEVLPAEEETPHHYARLFHQLRRQGTPIPTNDLWIGALVVQHQLYLFARDAHFDNLPQIPRV